MEHKPVFTIKIYGLNTNNQMRELLSTFTKVLSDDLYVYNPTFVNASINLTDIHSNSYDTFASSENVRLLLAAIPFDDFNIRQRSLLELTILKEIFPDSKIIIAYFLINNNPQSMSFHHYNPETAATLAKSVPAESHFKCEPKDATDVKNMLDSAIRIFLKDEIEKNFIASSIVLMQGLQQPDTKLNTLPKEILNHILFYTTDGILRSQKDITDKFNSIYNNLRPPINISKHTETITIKILGLNYENKIKQLLTNIATDSFDNIYVYNSKLINQFIYLIDRDSMPPQGYASIEDNEMIIVPINFNNSRILQQHKNELVFLKEAYPNIKIVIVSLINTNSSSTLAKQSFLKQSSSEDVKIWIKSIPEACYFQCEISDENSIKHMLDTAIKIFSPSVNETPKPSI